MSVWLIATPVSSFKLQTNNEGRAMFEEIKTSVVDFDFLSATSSSVDTKKYA